MYQHKIYGNIIVAIFTEAIELSDIEIFVKDIDTLTQTLDDVYVISLPINITRYPTNIGQLLKSVNLLQATTTKVKRLYGIQLNPMLSFLSTTITQILRIKSNTIEAKSIDELYRLIEKEATLFPTLQATIVHLDEIREYVESFSTMPEIR